MDDVELQTCVVVSLFRGAPTGHGLPDVDARVWRTDAFRAARLAQAALEHIPVVATVLMAGDGAFDEMLAFARSPAFVAVVEARAGLVASFGGYVRSLPRARGLDSLVALDEALVDIGELAPRDRLPAGYYQVSAGTRVIDLPVGVAAWHAAQFERLKSEPGGSHWERILGVARSHFALPQFGAGEVEPVMVVRGGHGRSGLVETLSTEMATLLRAVEVPRSVAELVEMFDGELTADDCLEILGGLVADGILVCGDLEGQ